MRAARLFVFGIAFLAATATGAATLSASPTSIGYFGSITASWSGIAAPSGSDWIALYTPGAPNGSSLNYIYTTGAASGSKPFNMVGIPAGTYELRLFSNGGYTLLATSNTFTIVAATLSVSQASAPLGGSVTASWSNIGAPSTSDWIGLFTPGSGDGSYVHYVYTTGTASGSVPFPIPAWIAAGTYQLRLFGNGGKFATSTNFAVHLPVTGTVTTSGGSALAGVSLSVPGGSSCTSNAAGQYICGVPSGWSGSITPSLAGYSFTPASRSYTNVTAAQTAQNYTGASYLVSGTVTLGGSGLAGVAFAPTGNGVCTTSNASGQYTCNVAPGWSGSITPSAAGYGFTPASREYTSVSANQSAQNYTAMYVLSGTVGGASPLAGVAFAASSGGSCTSSNAAGQYTCLVPPNWSGSVTPSLAGSSFTPPSRSYSNVAASQAAQNYTVGRSVSGTVTVGSLPAGGVSFTGTNGATCGTSNAAGQYICAVLHGWSGNITPALSGYSFTPSSRSHTNVTADLAAQDFAAAVSGGSARVFFIHTDHLNTPRLVADATGTTVWRWDQQEPFGISAPDENPSGLGNFEFPLRLPGQYADKETNLFYNYFRDYDSSIGRYVQSDPIGLYGGINTYAYVGAMPLLRVDPNGLQFMGAEPPPGIGTDWKWIPDAQNDRGGVWRDRSGKSANWDPSGHWDVWDQSGKRTRYDRWGNYTDLHRNPSRKGSDKPIVKWGRKVCKVAGPAGVAGSIGLSILFDEPIDPGDLICDLFWGCSEAH
jgi:RHS repeat-associated protein